MRERRRLWFLVFVMALICFIAMPVCASAAKPKAKKISLSATSESIVAGKKMSLKVKGVIPKNASKNVTWKSSNPKIASVNSKGQITAKKAGSVRITATSKSNKKVKATCKLRVYSKGTTAKRLVINKKTAKLAIGKKVQLKITKVRPYGTRSKVKWISSNKKVATVTAKGKVTAKRGGTATIKAVSVDNRKVVAKCKITVYKKTLKLINNGLATYNRKVGDTINLDVEISNPSRGAAPITWKSTNKKVATVDKKGKVSCKGVGSCSIVATSGGKKLSIDVNVREKTSNDGLTISKGEWVKLLLEKSGQDLISNVSLGSYYYADTEGTAYGEYIERAQKLGYLPPATSEGFVDPDQDVPLFYPDDPATREFVAYTSVMAMGFEVGTQKLTCSDSSSLKYPAHDYVAVQQGIIELENGYFYPERPFSYAERDIAFESFEIVQEPSVINTAGTKESISFQPGVIKSTIKKYTGYKIKKNANGTITATVPQNKNTLSIKKGTVFVLPANREHPDGVALKATSVKKIGRSKLTIKCKVPQISEVVAEMSFEGQGQVNTAGIETTSGVTYEYTEGTGLSQGIIGGSVAVPGTLKFTLNDKKIGNSVVEGSIGFSIPDITCRLQTEWVFKVKELKISTTSKVQTSIDIKYTDEESSETSGRIELGRVPVKLGTTGMSVDLVFFLNASLEATVGFDYSMTVTNGIQYVNGSFRVLKDVDQGLENMHLKGDAKAGGGIAVILNAFEVFDLAGINAQAGLGGNVSLKVQNVMSPTNPNIPLACGDGTVYLYLKIALDEETILSDLIEACGVSSIAWEIFDESNSPLRKSLHFENGDWVDECTLGKGGISGQITDAESGNSLNNARVRVYSQSINSNRKLLDTTYTDSNGLYGIDGLNAGDYVLSISATGYNTYEDVITVRNQETTYVNTALMISREDNGKTGIATGRVINALNGENLSQVNYTVKKGWNSTSGEVVTSGVINGNFSITLPTGNYVFLFSKTDFISSELKVAITEGTNTINGNLSPENVSVSGNLRIVLTWGSEPNDLDSHLLGTSADGEDYHVYYSDREYYENGTMVAGLDLDDTSSYGPETITVNKMNENGVYSYYVHDYSNDYLDDSYELSYSGATVSVYSGAALIAKYSVPAGKIGTLWHVFDYDAKTKTLRSVNQMSNLYNSHGLSRGVSLDEHYKEIMRRDLKRFNKNVA